MTGFLFLVIFFIKVDKNQSMVYNVIYKEAIMPRATKSTTPRPNGLSARLALAQTIMANGGVAPAAVPAAPVQVAATTPAPTVRRRRVAPVVPVVAPTPPATVPANGGLAAAMIAAAAGSTVSVLNPQPVGVPAPFVGTPIAGAVNIVTAPLLIPAGAPAHSNAGLPAYLQMPVLPALVDPSAGTQGLAALKAFLMDNGAASIADNGTYITNIQAQSGKETNVRAASAKIDFVAMSINP